MSKTTFHWDASSSKWESADIRVLSAYAKDKSIDVSHWKEKELSKHFKNLKHIKHFTAAPESSCFFNDKEGLAYLVVGVGEKKENGAEKARRALARAIRETSVYPEVCFDLESFSGKLKDEAPLELIGEVFEMTTYEFLKYKAADKSKKDRKLIVCAQEKKSSKKYSDAFQAGLLSGQSINVARDFTNEVPNFLRSDKYADLIKQDVQTGLKGKGVRVKVLDRAALKKEKMDLMLSVNSGSAFEPRLVHLTYKPKKKTKHTKHIALVGKGIVFDSGGYSLKPSQSMMGMKFDMGGSATVYGAFRSAVLKDCPHELTCLLAITDNAIGPKATYPDSVVKARNGKTVEILNTDAEGRLALADTLDYACDLGPDVVLDAATLTGACLVALGKEICALLSNNDKLVDKIKQAAERKSEYIWQLPIIDEFRQDMKSKVADLKNIGSPMRAGTATAAAFLEYFIKDGVEWAHFDVAGIADTQPQLPYCPPVGASGLMIRTITDYLMNA